MLYNTIKKKKQHAFGKDVYLLGKDKGGVCYWLEAPSWDCDWYWGFGYIETYTYNTRPQYSRDISSHQHAENFYPKWVLGDKSILTETTFTEKEAWHLSELFAQFYLFSAIADAYTTGSCNISTIKNSTIKDKKEADRLNKKILPNIMNSILEILTPKDN